MEEKKIPADIFLGLGKWKNKKSQLIFFLGWENGRKKNPS